MTIRNEDFTIGGQLFSPQSSVSSSARLIINDGYYRLSSALHNSDDADFTGLIETLRFDPKLGKAPRKIYTQNGYLFETLDFDGVEKIKGGSGFWSKLSQLERFRVHLVPLAILTPIAAFAFYRLMIPLVIGFAMFMTPTALMQKIDQSTVKTLDLIVMDDSNLEAEQKDRVTEIFDKLVLSAQESSDKARRIPEYKLLFRASDIGPNALALPGGKVLITDDLVTLFPDSPHVISAVLAHEIGHVEHEHSLRQLYRSLGMAAMIGFIAGDAGPILEDLVLEGSALLSLSFSRKHEMQADDFSFDLLTGTDQRSDGLIEFFEVLEKKYPGLESSEWMMTHPLSEKRIDNIKAKLPSSKLNPN